MGVCTMKHSTVRLYVVDGDYHMRDLWILKVNAISDNGFNSTLLLNINGNF